MKVLVIGGTGTLGQAIVTELSLKHDVIIAGSTSGAVQVDILSPDSIDRLYQKVKNLDAVVIAAGKTHFGPLIEMTEEQFYIGLKNKLMGQINIVLQGLKHLNPHGSFTLTSGILNHNPIVSGSNASAVNGAIDAFVKSAALELPHGIRINAVSPTVLQESLPMYASFFKGFPVIPAKLAAKAYLNSVEGSETGQVYRIGYS